MTVRIIDNLKQGTEPRVYKKEKKQKKQINQADYMEAYYKYLIHCIAICEQVSVLDECADEAADDYCDAARHHLARKEHRKVELLG